MESYPKPMAEWENQELREKFDKLFAIRTETSKKLEEARAEKVIGSSLEAELKIQLPEAEFSLTSQFSMQMLKEFFIVSSLELSQGPEINVQVQKAGGEKCPRCWNYDTLENTENYGPVCSKCVEALT